MKRVERFLAIRGALAPDLPSPFGAYTRWHAAFPQAVGPHPDCRLLRACTNVESPITGRRHLHGRWPHPPMPAGSPRRIQVTLHGLRQGNLMAPRRRDDRIENEPKADRIIGVGVTS